MPHYCVHGLKLEADFEIPELQPAGVGSPILDDAQVQLAMAKLPDTIIHQAVSKDGYLIGKNEILIPLDNGIRCHVSQGQRIRLDPGRPENTPAARLFALSAGIGCLLHQRGYIPLHCAAIETPAGCIAFTGNAGDGKSTLAASFAASGFSLFSDDRLTLHDTLECRYLAVPSVPVVHLFEEAADFSGVGNDHLAVNSYRFGKHIHLLAKSYATRPAPMAGMYFTDWLDDNTAVPVIRPMNRIEAMMRLRRDVSLAHLVGLLDQEEPFLRWSAELCSSVPVFHLARPKNKARHGECMDLILAHIEDRFGT